jgi:hypothetical protein
MQMGECCGSQSHPPAVDASHVFFPTGIGPVIAVTDVTGPPTPVPAGCKLPHFKISNLN